RRISTFNLPYDFGSYLVAFLKGLEQNSDEERVPAHDVFPDLGDPQRRIGIIFRGIRYKHHLTQVQVAQRLGLDQSDVSKIEKGKRAIGKALAKKVQHEFGIDYRRLL